MCPKALTQEYRQNILDIVWICYKFDRTKNSTAACNIGNKPVDGRHRPVITANVIVQKYVIVQLVSFFIFIFYNTV